ncbi:MAG: alpha/beta fold hydrolase [Chloroflexi bacterium]|jgi:proline-specific peptidase|nr:alpha/beta fold hydrolase [Chloroflexota bacterium]
MIIDQQGFIPVGDYKVWYRRIGGDQPKQPPLLLLHGGPGALHNYLLNLKELASEDRQVIFYDQLGCGNSDIPDDDSLWRVERFVEELGLVIKGLGLEKVHLLGQSWGGMLAIEYALTQPGTIESLILANTLSSMPLWVAEANRLRNDLPPEVQATLLKHEAAGTTESEEYQAALIPFYDRHVCRVPWTEDVAYSFGHILDGPVYKYMNGPSEFHVIGVIKDWDRTDRLGEIKLPTLIVSGRYDESTPTINEIMQKGIEGSEWVVFENSSHLAHVEEPEEYFAVVRQFLSKVEQAGVPGR